jgi:hypothetical protein
VISVLNYVTLVCRSSRHVACVEKLFGDVLLTAKVVGEDDIGGLVLVCISFSRRWNSSSSIDQNPLVLQLARAKQELKVPFIASVRYCLCTLFIRFT